MTATAAVPHAKLGRVFNSPRAADRIGTLADFLPRDKGVQVRALPPFNGGSSTRVKNDSSAEDQDDQEGYMSMTSEQREQVATELKRFAGDLNLTEQQKDKLHTALAEEREKVGEYLKAHPNTTKAEIVTYVKEHRAEIHQRVAAFLSPEQLSKWDSEVAKAKEFLGQRLDS